ncbi:ATP-dependent Clp protease proteolytic subunit 6-chloroplastic [Striga hermonthica]|uniref:ATP-dependent Clp protease proteolytic subunit n=1 Tax=Striga hermonthica TaxID=68872 RepID=A0A9N7MLY7_STRHE|nr:ATP-dependent Clp protease proteolytic subunit 6-chloroplastic [Striga hermonthica]
MGLPIGPHNNWAGYNSGHADTLSNLGSQNGSILNPQIESRLHFSPGRRSIRSLPRRIVTSAMAAPLNLPIFSPRYRVSSFSLFPERNLSSKPVVSSLSGSYGDSYPLGFSSKTSRSPLKLDQNDLCSNTSNGVIEARKSNPPIMPAVMTPAGPLDLSAVLFRNRIIFIGQFINSEVAQRVISQLVTLATIDEDSDILMYLNCPGGSIYSIMAIFDCMSWIKPKVGTVCFGMVASQASLILAGGEKGMRYAMPNARIMIHQPQCSAGGNVDDVMPQVNEVLQFRNKLDKMYSALTGQPVELVRFYTNRDMFFSAGEAMDFGLIDGILETQY